MIVFSYCFLPCNGNTCVSPIPKPTFSPMTIPTTKSTPFSGYFWGRRKLDCVRGEGFCLILAKKFWSLDDLIPTDREFWGSRAIPFAWRSQKLQKEDTTAFQLVPFIKDTLLDQEKLNRYQYELFYKMPFYEGLVYSPNRESIRTAIYLRKDIVNTAARRDFIIKGFDSPHWTFWSWNRYQGSHLRYALHPYTELAEYHWRNWTFGAALLITSFIFFFFFRSFRATFISMITVIVGVMWSLGF